MKILFSQKEPSNLQAYSNLKERYGADLEFRPFFVIEPLTSQEFRAQRVNIADYTAVVFSSRHAIDAYFNICDSLRFKVPDTMKYFCTTEMVAMYLQKHIVYRKRKIFFGNGKPESIVSLIGPKHKGEKFLIAASEGSDTSVIETPFRNAGIDFTVAALVKPVSQDLSDLDINSYDFCVLYNPNDVKSLYASFPDFKQDGVKFVSFGRSIVRSMQDAGLDIAVKAPSPEAPSAAKAIELYLSSKK